MTLSKFNRGSRGEQHAIQSQGPVTTTGRLGDAKTYEGAPAYTRDTKSELFLLAVVNMVGEDTFYESALDRDDRYAGLVRSVALADPQWVTNFIWWLRRRANMRSAAGVAAMEMARAWQMYRTSGVDAETASERRDGVIGVASKDSTRFNTPGPVRQAVCGAAARPDEPGEMLGYWLTKYGRALPKGAKRGLADAARARYNQTNALKYDTKVNTVRFADVIELTHAAGRDDRQNALFHWLIDRRHGREMRIEDAPHLHIVTRHIALRQLAETQPEVLLDPDRLRAAGMTWEDVISLSGKLDGLDKKQVWEAIIPSLPYMATLRNLRNIEQAEVSPALVELVQKRLADPEEVRDSRQFPYRFLSAYLNTNSHHWSQALEAALQTAVQNIPSLPGRTLVLVDTSGSMEAPLSRNSKISRMMAGALFGVALAHRTGQADLYGFADGRRPFIQAIPSGSSVLKITERFVGRCGEDGHGTAIAQSIKKTFRPGEHDRVVLFTDMQSSSYDYWGGGGRVHDTIPKDVPLYAFNLAGYRATPLDTRTMNRYEFGGLTDATFQMIPLLEAGTSAGWPWEQPAVVD